MAIITPPCQQRNEAPSPDCIQKYPTVLTSQYLVSSIQYSVYVVSVTSRQYPNSRCILQYLLPNFQYLVSSIKYPVYIVSTFQFPEESRIQYRTLSNSFQQFPTVTNSIQYPAEYSIQYPVYWVHLVSSFQCPEKFCIQYPQVSSIIHYLIPSVQNPVSTIQYSLSSIKNPESGIQNHVYTIQYISSSRIQQYP